MKIFSFIDSMKKFSREMPDDDILVQYELNGEKQPLSFVNFEKRVMSFAALLNENGIKKVLKDYERIVSINTIRASVVNSYVGIVSASWVIAMIAILFKNKIPKAH